MKVWNKPELAELSIAGTENGFFCWDREIDPACWNLGTGSHDHTHDGRDNTKAPASDPEKPSIDDTSC